METVTLPIEPIGLPHALPGLQEEIIQHITEGLPIPTAGATDHPAHQDVPHQAPIDHLVAADPVVVCVAVVVCAAAVVLEVEEDHAVGALVEVEALVADVDNI